MPNNLDPVAWFQISQATRSRSPRIRALRQLVGRAYIELSGAKALVTMPRILHTVGSSGQSIVADNGVGMIRL